MAKVNILITSSRLMKLPEESLDVKLTCLYSFGTPIVSVHLRGSPYANLLRAAKS